MQASESFAYLEQTLTIIDVMRMTYSHELENSAIP